MLNWAASLARDGANWYDVRERAARVGTLTHDILQRYPDPLPMRPLWTTSAEWTKVCAAYSEYARWMDEHNPVIVDQEVLLVSEHHQAGGTPDQILRVGNELVISDHKTGKWIDIPKVCAQLAFYADAYEENKGGHIERGIILHYTATGLKPIEVSPDQLKAGLALFILARATHRLLESFPGKRGKR